MTVDGLASLAGLLADRTRAQVCMLLLDGRAWTAGELAGAVDVAASTMSEHLSRMVDGGLLIEHRQGRHRYVALAGPHVAGAVEQLMALTEPGPPPRNLRAVSAAAALRRGRTCYDHLAGRLGVVIADAMVAGGLLDDDLAVTVAGRGWLSERLGVDLAALAASRRPLSRACLDWTERRPHLAGAAGAQLCQQLIERGWVQRTGSGRAVRTTPAGDVALEQLLGVSAC